MTPLTLPPDAAVLAASDMHLGIHDPGTARFFLTALDAALGQGSNPPYTHLLLMGDLFEAWPGDDCQDPVALTLISTLQRISKTHVVLVIVGNRDFLLNVPLPPPNRAQNSFSETSGAQLLNDQTVLTIGPQRLLLMHGDSLCTDDLEYQRLRAQVRSSSWQQQFLTKPLAEREQTALQMRTASEQNKLRRSCTPRDLALDDVSQQAVDEHLTQAECNTLVHGHTHRPNVHEWPASGGAPGISRRRYVLPDWDEPSARGGFLQLDKNGVRALPAVS